MRRSAHDPSMVGAASYTPDWHSPWYLMKGNHGASSDDRKSAWGERVSARSLLDAPWFPFMSYLELRQSGVELDAPAIAGSCALRLI